MSSRSVFPDDLVYRAAELFCTDVNLSAAEIARLVNDEFGHEPRLTRETAYGLISEARERRHLQLRPPRVEELERALAATFKIEPPRKVYVVNVHSRASNAFVAAAAADLVYGLLGQYARSGRTELGLGLGAGRAARDFSRHLGILLSRSEHPIKLHLTAIAAGCPAREPQSAPSSHFAFYPPGTVIDRVGFFAKSVMSASEFWSEDFRDKPGVTEAFAQKKRIDVVVTSMGDFRDEHDLMSKFLRESGLEPRDCLPNCVGSVQYRPYTPTGPSVEPDHVPRAATLFELNEFVEMAGDPNRHVVLISRVCGACPDPAGTHEAALVPLLKEPTLRVWSEIVLDVPTALAALASQGQVVDPAELTRIRRVGRAFRAVELFSEPRAENATRIAEAINADFPAETDVSREMVYNLIQVARKDRFVTLVPRLETSLAREVAAAFGLDPQSIRVVDTPTKEANPMVAERAAEWVYELAASLTARLGSMWESSEPVAAFRGVGLGVGPGRASFDFCRSLGELVRKRNADALKLRLISLAAGSPADSPQLSSANFFNLFPDGWLVDQVGYIAETVLRQSEFASPAFRKTTGVREAFEEKERGRIHIVVNSMGNPRDRHDLLRKLLLEGGKLPAWLGERPGSVQYRPFDANGPIREPADARRAATLFELDDFVRMAAMKQRHVVLIARRCGICGETHAAGLRHLLKEPNLKVWSELVIDAATARELLGDEKPPRARPKARPRRPGG